MPPAARVCVPATTANLGPGFDCLGLSLDLWNEAEFRLEDSGWSIEIEGEGARELPLDETNLVLRAFRHFCAKNGRPAPAGLRVRARSAIPVGSGLGSSAAAVLLGLLGASALCGISLPAESLLGLAVDLEGHADNAAAALLGGLSVVLREEGGWLARRFDVPALRVALALPACDLPTAVARQALPASIPRADAVYNVSRAVLVAEALRAGDLDLLGLAMDDRLHQPYRLPLIPGAASAMAAARLAGAKAVAISGAGPSLIAFCPAASRPVGEAMVAAFEVAGVAARAFDLTASSRGACVETIQD